MLIFFLLRGGGGGRFVCYICLYMFQQYLVIRRSYLERRVLECLEALSYSDSDPRFRS